MESNKPEIQFSAGAISVAIWTNKGTSKEGQDMEYRTFSFERRYKDKSGEWRSTNHLRMQDIPKAVLVLNKAYEHVMLNQRAPEAIS